MYVAKRGNAAPQSERRNVFAAIADAALRSVSQVFGDETCKYLQHEICIDQVVETLQEDRHDTKSGTETTQRGHNPWNVFGEAGPSEPKSCQSGIWQT